MEKIKTELENDLSKTLNTGKESGCIKLTHLRAPIVSLPGGRNGVN